MFKQIILKAIGGDPEDWLYSKHLLGMGVWMGIFLATYTTAVGATFIDTFDEREFIPYAIVCQGIVGILFTWLLNGLGRSKSFKLSTRFILLIFIVIISLITYDLAYLEGQPWCIFTAYVVMLPCNSLLVVIFWDTFNRIFSLRKIKQLVSGIDTGQSISSIVSYFSIPLIILFVPSPQYLLVISAAAIVLFTIQLYYIQSRFDYKDLESDSKVERSKTRADRQKHKQYIRILSIFIIISVFAATFVEYSFLTIINDQYGSQVKLTNFLSFFGALVVIASFLIQVFLNDLILANLGLKKSLLIVPSIIFVIACISIIGEYIFSGESGLIFFIFVLLSVNQLFVASLRDALEFPTVKYYFFVLPQSIRFTEQNRVEGIIRLIGLVSAGLLMSAIERVYKISVVEDGYILIVLVFIWFFINHRLALKYQSTLQNALKSSFVSIYHNNRIAQIYDDFRDQFKRHDFFVNLFKNISPTTLNSKEKPPVELQISKPDNLRKNLYSKEVADRLETLKYIRLNPDETHLQYLKDFFFDPHPQVKKLAFKIAAELKYVDALAVFVEYFDKPFYTNTIFEGFIMFSNHSLPYLERIFTAKPSQLVMRHVVKIIGLIGTPEAIKWLEQKVYHLNKEVNHLIMTQLALMNQKLPSDQHIWIKNRLSGEIADLLRTTYLMTYIEHESELEELQHAIEAEIHRNHKSIFDMLSIIYDPSAIELIEINFFTNTTENISYALELLELMLDDDLKPIILPALTDYTNEQKIKRLGHKYGLNLLNLDEDDNFWRLLFGMNDNEGFWIIILGLEYYLKLYPKGPISDPVLALTEHPHYSISEMAIWVCYVIDRSRTEQIIQQLPEKRRPLIEYTFKLKNEIEDIPFLKRQQVKWLQESPLFADIESYILLLIAEGAEVYKYTAKVLTYEKDSFQEYIHILIRGSLIINDNIINQPYQLLNDLESEEIIITTMATEETWVYRIEKSHLYLFLKHYPAAFNQFMTNIKIHLDEEIEAQALQTA